MGTSPNSAWKILLVEDDEDDYLLTRDLLMETEGTQVELDWVREYAEAQRQISERRHDLYLFDYRLGGYTGLDLLYFTLAQGIHTPVILLTGQTNLASPSLETNVMQAGAVYYLVKSQLNASALERSIRYALDHKNNEDILRKGQEELEQRVAERTTQLAEKNRELQAFSYSVSHDLKAPLRAIDGYSRLLQEEYAAKLAGDGQTFIQNIRTATEQMSQLIDDLLDYSRAEQRPFVNGVVNLKSLVETLLAERAAEIQARAVTVTTELEWPNVFADPNGLGQALRNLLDNALKFTQHTPQPHLTIGSRSNTARTCLLWVRDNGIGFDMKYHERIFEIFQRLQLAEDYAGTGVGLALVSKTVKRMNGRVWAEGAPGAGATFYIELKQATAPDSAAEARP